MKMVVNSIVRWIVRPADAEKNTPAAVVVHAPVRLVAKTGDELWQWYGNAGWGEDNKEDWDEAEGKFLAQYGFLPWE